MDRRHTHLRTSFTLLTVSIMLLGGAGCRGTAARSGPATMTSTDIVPPDPNAVEGASTPVPPLSGVREAVAEAATLASATTATDAVQTVAGSARERVPAPPATTGFLPPEPENSSPVPPPSRIVETASEAPVLQAAQADVPCVPVPTAWMGQMQSQNAALLKRIESLEAQLVLTQENLRTVNGALETSRSETRRLEQELARWKTQVRELEETLVRQQEEDLRSLNELAGALNQLVPPTNSPGGEP